MVWIIGALVLGVFLLVAAKRQWPGLREYETYHRDTVIAWRRLSWRLFWFGAVLITCAIAAVVAAIS